MSKREGNKYKVKIDRSRDSLLSDFGKPVACGGHIGIKDGKIVTINEGSGHYTPITDQLKLAAHHLAQYQVLAVDVDIVSGSWCNNRQHFTLADIEAVNIGDILEQYSDLI